MIALLYFILAVVVSPFKSKSRLEAENAALRYQLIVLRRKVTGRVRLSNGDRLVCAEILIRFIWPTESPNVGLGCLRCTLLPGPILIAIQVEEPT
jgi:hypothetical protein